jgi:cell volume regulation protein A
MVKPSGSTTLRKGDVVSIIGHNEDEEFLNFIFNGNADVRKTPHFYHGDIILDGKLKMTEVARDYNLVITSLEKPLTLNEFLSYQLGGFPMAGDRFTLIDIRLYVQETQEDKITKIGYEKLDSI